MTRVNCDERTKRTLCESIEAEQILRWAIRERKIMWEKS